MVDLVKIRKKAKEKKAATAEAEESPSPQPEPQEALVTGGEPEPAAAALPSPVDRGAAAAGAARLEEFKQTAGRQREEETTIEAEEEADRLELLTFRVAGETYALPIEHVFEITELKPMTRIPNADAEVMGVVSLRGTIVTLLDLRRRLGHPAVETLPADARIIVVERNGEYSGFPVDQVLRVARVAPAVVEAHPVVAANEQNRHVRGVFQQDETLTILLELDELLVQQGA